MTFINIYHQFFTTQMILMIQTYRYLTYKVCTNFCFSLPSMFPADLTEDEDIKNLLQRLSERSELMKKHPGGALRPSSVRG